MFDNGKRSNKVQIRDGSDRNCTGHDIYKEIQQQAHKDLQFHRQILTYATERSLDTS